MGMIKVPGFPDQTAAAPAPAPPDAGELARRSATDAYAALVRLKSDPEFYAQQYGPQGYAQAVAAAQQRYQAATYAYTAARQRK